MKAIVLVLCFVSFGLTAKQDSSRKSRQVYGQVFHPGSQQIYDYSHPQNLYSSPLQYVQPPVPTLGLTHHQIIPQLAGLHPTAQVALQQGLDPLHHGTGYLANDYLGQIYGNGYSSGQLYGNGHNSAHLYSAPLLQAPARHGVPEIHPVTERTHFDFPTPTPLYGVAPSPHRSSNYHQSASPTTRPYTTPYHQTTTHFGHNLASQAPYTFPPTYPTSHSSSYYSRQFGSRENLYSASRFIGSTPSPRVSTLITSAYSPSNQESAQNGQQVGTQQTGSRVEQTAVILSQSGEIRNDGSYDFGFQSDNGIRSSESGIMRPVGTEMAPAVQGAYSYTAPDGTPISASYIADETGFHVQGAHIPTAPSSSPALLGSSRAGQQSQQVQQQSQQVQQQSQQVLQQSQQVTQQLQQVEQPSLQVQQPSPQQYQQVQQQSQQRLQQPASNSQRTQSGGRS